ncbi:TRAP transporter large permease [Pseudorhodobacter aquimaris]|uniref:TRAP transporter large permease n=1 Tax=Pseudorhodobacter aquimaris TaxID=687412 RepID=UPI00067AE578|nr:TRAP transporter large permease [Pseudorhodobacter aquimaris]
MAEILFPALFILLALGLPVAFAMAIAVFAALSFGSSYPNLVVVKEMFAGLDSFPLLAVPFFVLAAEIMTGGAITLAMLRLAQSLVGHLKGGLGHANVVSSAMFAGISGSALADAAGPGTMMIRMMEKGGYHRAYAGALTIASSVVGPIIPPSITMIIYAMQDQEVSVGSLFMAGVLPGILITVLILVANAYVSHKRGYASGAPMPPVKEIIRVAIYAVPALFLVVLIVGGIRFGVFTPTEASVIAVFYALFVGMFIYRSLHIKDLPGIILRAALVSTAVLLILGAARAFAWVLIIEGIPQFLAETIIAWDLSPIVFLLAVNLLLLIFGLFMDPLPGVMILVPILAPISLALGIDPDHFAIIVIVNLTLGLTTPPVGSLIFVVSSTMRIKPTTLIKEMPPFFLALALALLLITFVPVLSTWLPGVSGF